MTDRRILTPGFRVDAIDGLASADLETIRACELIIGDVRFDATTLPIDELMFSASTAGLSLIVDLRVPDRDKPDVVEFIHIWRTLICPWDPIRSNGPEYLVRWMRETIANTITHEVDENISLRGERVFDPHRALGGD